MHHSGRFARLTADEANAVDSGAGSVRLVTLHPVNAASSLGKGAGVAGKDVTVGTVKGAGKIGKGIGKAVKKIF